MDFTDSQQDILVRAWLLACHGQGQVLDAWAVRDAARLCEAGWLEGRTVDATGDDAFFSTHEAETALDMTALRLNAPGDLN